jgi:hypothetical protein
MPEIGCERTGCAGAVELIKNTSLTELPYDPGCQDGLIIALLLAYCQEQPDLLHIIEEML